MLKLRYFEQMLIASSLLIALSINIYADQDQPDEVLIGNELRDVAMDDDYVWIATNRGLI